MRPKQGMEPCQKTYFKLKQKDKATFYSLAEERVLPVAETQEPEEKKFVVDSGAGMHVVSRKDLNFAELETMRMSRSPTTVMTANGEVQTREEAMENVKELDLFVTVTLLGRNTRSSSTREALRGSGGYIPLDQRSKTTSRARQLIAMCQTMDHSLSLVYRRVALRRPHTYSIIIFITGFCF